MLRAKSYLTNLVALSVEMSSSVNKGKAVGVVYLNFSKVFDMVSHSNRIAKSVKQELSKWTTEWK